MKYLIGVGNYAMFDDSIAIRMIEHITENRLENGFQALDLSANILNLLSYFNAETEKILVIDTAKMGKSPGEFALFGYDDIDTRKSPGNLSSHEGDLYRVLTLAHQMNYVIPPLQLLGIEPFEIKNGFGLSKPLLANFDQYVEVAIEYITS